MDQKVQSIEFLYDFLYLDRSRVDFYFAQLFEDGVITQTKRTAKDSSTDTAKMGGSIKIISGEHSETDAAERGLERVFDPSWLAPIEVLNRLDEFRFVHREIESTPIGSLFLTAASLSIIDIRMLKEMWGDVGELIFRDEVAALNLGPKEKQRALADRKRSFDQLAKILQRLPHAIQASFGVNGDTLWSTLRPESMLINPDDLALKHGSEIPGQWYVLGIVDAQPGPVTAIRNSTIGLELGMAQILKGLREAMGRPASAYGVTPIAIFRAARPYAA